MKIMVYSSTKKSAKLDRFFKPVKTKREVKSFDRDNLCTALTTKGKNCSRNSLPNSYLCKLHQNKEEKRDIYVKWLKDKNPNISSEIPEFLIPYTDRNLPPNQVKLIYRDKPNRAEYIKFYGEYKGHPFTEKDLIEDRNKIKKVCCIHDANHSIALFLKTKNQCQFAFHNYIPLVFAGTKEFVKFYTQKYSYPLVITEVKANVNDLFVKNGVHKAMGRWCTRLFKMEASYWFYRHYNLNNIVQYLGITNDTPNRAKKYPEGIHKSKLSEKKQGFNIYNFLPIRNFLLEEQEILIKKHNLPPNPIKKKYGSHGCIYCPMRSELYYFKLREWFPDLYAQCIDWKKYGSARSISKGKKQYLYYPNSKIM